MMEHHRHKVWKNRRPRCGIVTLTLFSTLTSCCESFVQQPQQPFAFSSTQLKTSQALPDISDVIRGESCVDPKIQEFFDGSTDAPLDGDSNISSFAAALSYDKYLTMQTKRVPVSVRYSEKSGLKPYYLTVAKKIKKAFPDIVLEKIILPKVHDGESTNSNEGSTFEVLVDGKVVVRSPSRKGSFGEYIHVFVNMQEIEVAIVRARKRRRPQTVYGEDDSNARLEILKNKVADKNSSLPTKR